MSNVTKTEIYSNDVWQITKHFDNVFVIESYKDLSLGQPKVYTSLSEEDFYSLAKVINKIGIRKEEG